MKLLAGLAATLRAREAEARREAAELLVQPPALAQAVALQRARTAALPEERRRTARVLHLVEQATARPDTATRWADPKGRWDGSPVEQLARLPEPVGLRLFGYLIGRDAWRRGRS